MRQRFPLLAILLAGCATTASSSPGVWKADRGDGTYQNPVLHADYSDPDAIRVGRDFYMTASSFNASPDDRSCIRAKKPAGKPLRMSVRRSSRNPDGG